MLLLILQASMSYASVLHAVLFFCIGVLALFDIVIYIPLYCTVLY